MAYQRVYNQKYTQNQYGSKQPANPAVESKQDIDLSRYTDEQRAIIETSMTSPKLIINALAGSGKTTTALACAAVNKNVKGLYICFNRANADAMAAKIAKKPGAYNLDVMTAHAFAHRYVANNLKSNGKELKAYIPVELVEANCKFTKNNGNAITDFYYKKRLAKLVYETMSAFCHSKAATIENFKTDYANIQLNEQLKSLNVNKENFFQNVENLWKMATNPDCKNMPFTHDCYLKLFEIDYNTYITKSQYGFLIADEAQDLFPVVESLVEKINHNGARLLCLGDRYQQIYAWNKSINTMSRLEKDADILYLTKSFRCPQEVTELALPWLRLLGYKGEFIGRDDMDDFSGMGKHAILSRTNSGVLLDINNALENLGKPGLIHLVGKGPSYDFDTIFDRIAFINEDFNKIKHLGMKQCRTEDEYDKYALAAMDREMEQSKYVVEKLGPQKTIAIINMIKKSDFCERPEQAKIIISTAHKSKGLEFETVEIGESFKNIEEEYAKHMCSQNNKKAASSNQGELLSSSELSNIENSQFVNNCMNDNDFFIDTTQDPPMSFNAEELRLNYVAITRSANQILPGSLELDENSFENTKELLATKKVVLKDQNIHGNMVLYKANVDYKTLQVHSNQNINQEFKP